MVDLRSSPTSALSGSDLVAYLAYGCKLKNFAALGLCLAAFSAALPYLGRFLEGAGVAGRAPLLEGSRQVFVIPDDLSAEQKEDMAWASYVLLQNTNTTSVIMIPGAALPAYPVAVYHTTLPTAESSPTFWFL